MVVAKLSTAIHGEEDQNRIPTVGYAWEGLPDLQMRTILEFYVLIRVATRGSCQRWGFK